MTLGEAHVWAEAPSGYDRGRVGPVIITEPGATISVEVHFDGVGTIRGEALEADGVTPLQQGTVTFTNTEWPDPVKLACPVVDGSYRIENAPAGPFSLKLAVPGRTAAAGAAETLESGQVLTIPLILEPAGTVTGKVIRPDGTTPAVGTDVTVKVTRPVGGTLTLTTHTDAAGIYRLDQVILGMIEISVHLLETDGRAAITALHLSSNGQVLEAPLLVLDEEPIRVQSVSPTNGSVGVSRSTVVRVTFTEPADPSTVNTWSFSLFCGPSQVSGDVTLSPDSMIATLTPHAILPDNSIFTVVVSTQVRDLFGRNLPAEFRSTFATPDETPPVVTSVDPAAETTNVDVEKIIEVSFNEALDPEQAFAGVVRLFPDGHPEALVPLVITLSESGKTLIADPSVPLSESTRYRIEVTSQKDLAGNIQTALFSSRFSTIDRTKPVIDSVSVEGEMLLTATPLIVVYYHDDFSGIDPGSVILRLDGQDIRAGASVHTDQIRYQVPDLAPLGPGEHVLEIQVSDKAGNTSDLKSASFTIDNVPPEITSFTIAGWPATDGMMLTVFRPVFEASYSDNGAIDPARVILRLGREGEPLFEVPAAATSSGLTYQPSTDLQDGVYFVELVVVDLLGNSVSAGPIRFVIDVDAPQITLVAPISGTQHGGTVVVIEGARLLQPDGSWPLVTVGGSPAYVVSSQVGPPETVTIVTPPGAPGLAPIRVETERGVGTVSVFCYEPDRQTPFAVESDTLLLWHFDQPGDTYGMWEGQLVGSAPFFINAWTDADFSRPVPGRFGFGRTGNVWIEDDFGLLTFENRSFTVEFWMKTAPVDEPHVLVGNYEDNGTFAVLILPSGAIYGRVIDDSGLYWEVSTAAGIRADDGQWHQVTLVVDREGKMLRLYVDGLEQAAEPEPVGFGGLTDCYYLETGFGDRSYDPFPGVIDEVRISAGVKDAARVLEIFLGQEGPLPLEATYVTPVSLIRGREQEIRIYGYNLEHVQAEMRDEEGVSFPVQVASNSATEARILVDVPTHGESDLGRLFLRGHRGEVTREFRLIDPTRSAPQLEADTLVLWRLDEEQGITLGRDTASLIDPQMSPDACEGFFGRARSGSVTGTSTPLRLTDASFTLEAWVRLEPFSLIQIYGSSFLLSIADDSDGLVALLSGTKADLQAKAPLLLYSESGRGSVRPRVGTGWRHVAMTVDRQAGRLAVYLDGIEQAATDIPENFALREVESGLWIWSWGSTVVDEIRLSSTAHTPAKIWEDFSGSHSFDVTSILPFQVNQPRLINRGSSTRLEINGFELDGVRAELRRNGAVLDGTSISILESAYRRAVVELVLGPAVELGDADLVIIGPDDAAITCPVQIIDPQPLAVDPQTLLLWRLDEPGDGVTEIADAGPVRLRGSSGASSKAVEGRFAGGRFCANIAAVPDNGLLGFSETSFTVQAWFKGRRPNADGLLFGRSAYKTGWGLWLLANGRLRVDLWNQSGLQCQAEVPVLTDVASGFRKVDIADDLWHFLTLVVDREVSAIKIYADGILVLQAAIPADFGPLKTAADGVFRVGYTSYSDPGLPGVLDEVRIRHGASSDEQVWQEFSGIGSPRITGVFPSIINRDRISPASTTEVLVEGYNLSGVTGQIVRDGNVIPGTSVAVAEASDRFARLLIGLPSDVGLGAAQLRLHGGDETAEETLLIAERRPLSVEEDTVVLWHMDEPENGAIRVSDESDFAVSGTADPESEAIPGRFGLGRTRALIEADDDYGLLDFGSSSFTLQCWVRTEEIASNYILVGKSMPAGQAPKYWISLSRNNRIIASVRDTYFREWKAEAGPVFQDSAGNWTVKSVTDGQWHMITMVVDREAGVLRLYLDGSEAAASPIPDGFGPTRSGERLHAGNRDVYSGGGSAGPEEFPGVIDEIRVSSSAHSPEKVMADFLGHEQPEITKISPGWVPAGARGFPVTLHGTYLSEISIQSDSPFVQVDSFISGANKCDLWITISDLAPSCPARLTVTDSLGHSCHADLVITTAQPFPDASAAENDTLVLWRLDEPEDGAIEIQGYGDPIAIGQDYVPIPIQATSSPASVSAEGRFGRGRALADLVARSDFGSFEPGLSSFTLQCWFKTRPVGRTYMLVGRSGVDGHAHEFGIHLFPSGLLRAFLIDTAHNNWQVDVPARLYDASSSVWRTCVVDDEQWHLLTMVVDRASDQLMLYVDQELRASAPAPTGFGALRNSNLRFRAGLKNIWSGGIAAFPDADQFPGVLDEVRLISGVRTSEEIRADFGLPTSSPEDTTSFVGGQAVDKLNRDWALRPLRKAATAPFENIDQGDGETLLLWRLDERRNGAIRIAGAGDAVPEIIGGIASPASIAETGRFAGGRTNAGITADPDNSALDFGASSFTLEFWLRTDPVFATFTLAGRDGPLGESKDFGISLLPSGGLRAWLYDEAGLEWSAESEAPVDDSVWRLVTMSVDREAGWLYLLIDDEVVAASPCPDGFKGVRNQGQPFRAGHLDAFGPARFTAPAEFPGVLDEMRVLNYARKPGETK
ncbi:MAG TPA: Ig-like domain-containing protein [Acidobacteriota bacterium]|nr:Ig-like domain-containing protein [Acidobacteriota bacterium]